MSEIKRYKADVGGDKTTWPIVVPDNGGHLVYYGDHLAEVRRLLELNTELTNTHNTLVIEGSRLRAKVAALEAELEYFANRGRTRDHILITALEEEASALRAKVTALEAENGRLKAPVSAAEWNGAWQELARQSCIGKYQFSKIASFLIAARAQQPNPAQDKEQG